MVLRQGQGCLKRTSRSVDATIEGGLAIYLETAEKIRKGNIMLRKFGRCHTSYHNDDGSYETARSGIIDNGLRCFRSRGVSPGTVF